MILKKYQNYIIKTFLKNFLIVSLIFLSISFILNIFEEIKFFEKFEIDFYYPIFLTLLNVPTILLEIFPFIFLISTKFFFINLNDKNEMDILKNNGIKNSNILFILVCLSVLIGLFFLVFYYTVSSNLKSSYLNFKNNFSNDNKYLAVVNENGLWIKEEIDDFSNIIHAEKFKSNSLENIYITQVNSDYSSKKSLIAKKANLKEKTWILYDVKFIEQEKRAKFFDKYEYKSSFDGQIISNLFSNLNSLNIYQLYELYKNYSKIGYSTTEVSMHLQKLIGMPIYFTLMTILGFIIIIKVKFLTSKIFTVIIGVSVSVIVYYLNYFSNIFGINETVPTYISVWIPLLILFLICTYGMIKLNET